MKKCPQCKGKGVVLVKVNTAGEEKDYSMDMDCPTCQGKTTISDKAYKQYQAEQDLWCDCDNSTFGCYPQDGECDCGIYKHHVHCGNCNKLTQIG